jgi:hypothetical protein
VASSIPAGDERRLMCPFHIAAFKQTKRSWLAACSIVLELELNADNDYCFGGTGNVWSITRPALHASIFHCDPAVTSSFANFLHNGRVLSVMCPSSTYNTKAALTTSSSYSLPIQRGFSVLACIEFSLVMSRPAKKECITFDHPLAGAVPNSTNDHFAFHAALGSSRWPTQDVLGVAAASPQSSS